MPDLARVVLPSKGARRQNPAVLTAFDEVRGYLDAADAYAAAGLDRDATCLKLAHLGLALGLRPEKRFGLDWGDFDWDAGFALVVRACTSAERGLALKGTKTGRAREVPLPARLVDALRPLAGDGPVFPGRVAERLSPSTAHKLFCFTEKHKHWLAFTAWAQEGGRVGVRISIENCRHSFATAYLHGSGNVEDLSKLLGHAEISTTYRRYVRPSAEDVRRAALRIVDL